MTMLNATIAEDYPHSVDIDSYQRVLPHALSNVDFSISTGIYLVPNNLNLNIGNPAGYNNTILVSNTGTKFTSVKNINKTEAKSQLPVAKPEEAHLIKKSRL